MAVTEVMRAYRVALDPTQDQRAALASHAGASRAAYNYHLARNIAAHRSWSQEVAWATYTEHADLAPTAAHAAAKKSVAKAKLVRFPTCMDTSKVFCIDPGNAWYGEVNRYALTSGMQTADRAWKNWTDSATGQRSGRRIGYPRFHAKGRTRDSFTLYHDVKRPTLRPDGYRRLVLPEKITGKRGGSIRLHGNVRKLARRIAKGSARIQSVTMSRGGRRWGISILAKEQVEVPDRPNLTQRTAGPVGVDVGVHHYAALSTGQIIDNPRHLRTAAARLARAQRALARTGWWLLDTDGQTISYSRHTPRRGVRKKPTAGRLKAQARVARLHADLAERRATTQHALTKHLATRHELVAIEDLNVAGMISSAKGTLEEPGRNVAAKSGLNRSILDVGFGEIRRQLDYKTPLVRITTGPRGPVRPDQQDLLGVRDSESQAVPGRAGVPLHLVRYEDGPGRQRGPQHPHCRDRGDARRRPRKAGVEKRRPSRWRGHVRGARVDVGRPGPTGTGHPGRGICRPSPRKPLRSSLTRYVCAGQEVSAPRRWGWSVTPVTTPSSQQWVGAAQMGMVLSDVGAPARKVVRPAKGGWFPRLHCVDVVLKRVERFGD